MKGTASSEEMRLICQHVCARQRRCTWLTVQISHRNSSTDNLLSVGAADAACSVRFSADWESLSSLFLHWPFVVGKLWHTYVPAPRLCRAHWFSSFLNHRAFPSDQCSRKAFSLQKCQALTSGAWRAETVSRFSSCRRGSGLFEESLEMSEADRRKAGEAGSKSPAVTEIALPEHSHKCKM